MLLFVNPIQELSTFVTRIWIFESDHGLPDNNIVAPNARPKIIMPYVGSITTTTASYSRTCVEHGIYFIGIRDVPVRLSTAKVRTGSLGLELTTEGAYKLFQHSMHEFVNDVFSFRDCFGDEGRVLENEIADHPSVYEKADILQMFLLTKIRSLQRLNVVVDYVVREISDRKGMMMMRDLERRTGYTKRYLDMLFRQHVGISPKALSTIVRFQHWYKGAANEKMSVYDLYYDESHFIKEFKRYTGYTPGRFAVLSNDFGKNF